MTFLVNFLKGAVVGVANIIPGVSGGTMAVITGIYERIIGIISGLFKNIRKWSVLKKDLLFLLPVILGALTGILLLSNLIKYLLESHYMPTLFCFLGLIAGSLPLIFKKANHKGFNGKYLIGFLVTLAFMLTLAYLSAQSKSITSVESFGTSLLDFLLIAIYGMIAATAMVVPGISGSMIMMMLGVYNAVIDAVSSLNITVLIPFIIGAVLGIVLISKLIKLLLDRFYGYTYYVILGFVAGSIVFIFPGFAFNMDGPISLAAFAAGAAISYKVSALKPAKHNQTGITEN